MLLPNPLSNCETHAPGRSLNDSHRLIDITGVQIAELVLGYLANLLFGDRMIFIFASLLGFGRNDFLTFFSLMGNFCRNFQKDRCWRTFHHKF